MFFMVADVRLVASPAEEPNSGWNGEVPIFDMAGFTLKHLTCVVLSVLRVYMKYTQEAHPVRLRQIHVINCASYLDRIMALVRPFMRKEVAKVVSLSAVTAKTGSLNHFYLPQLNFHKPNSQTLYEFVPKDLLPAEYGGKCGEIRSIKDDFGKLLNQYR